MNRITVLWLILLVPFLSVQSQEKQMQAQKHFITIGYGYKIDTKWWKKEMKRINFDEPKRTDDGYIKYEFEVNNKLGIGYEAGFIYIEDSRYIDWFESYSYTMKAIRLLSSFNYHFLNTHKFNFHVSMGLGFYITKTKVVYNHPDPNPLNTLGFPPSLGVSDIISNRKKVGIDFNSGVCLRYFFLNNIGIYCETGINKSVFQTGLVIKLQKKIIP